MLDPPPLRGSNSRCTCNDILWLFDGASYTPSASALEFSTNDLALLSLRKTNLTFSKSISPFLYEVGNVSRKCTHSCLLVISTGVLKRLGTRFYSLIHWSHKTACSSPIRRIGNSAPGRRIINGPGVWWGSGEGRRAAASRKRSLRSRGRLYHAAVVRLGARRWRQNFRASTTGAVVSSSSSKPSPRTPPYRCTTVQHDRTAAGLNRPPPLPSASCVPCKRTVSARASLSLGRTVVSPPARPSPSSDTPPPPPPPPVSRAPFARAFAVHTPPPLSTRFENIYIFPTNFFKTNFFSFSSADNNRFCLRFQTESPPPRRVPTRRERVIFTLNRPSCARVLFGRSRETPPKRTGVLFVLRYRVAIARVKPCRPPR